MRTKYKIEEQDKLYYVTLLKHRTRHKVTNRDMGYGAWSQSEPAESDFIATQTVTTDYVSNKIYKNGQLSMLLTEEGYIEKSGSTYTHHYYLKDHIGNHRIVMNSAGTVVQATNYYPSGTTMADYPRATTQGVQPYKFGGKELDRKDNLNFYDYEARAYDPTLMRFTSTDPMMEKYYAWSPFAYCNNNPVNAIDPDGRSTWVMTNDDGTYRIVGGDLEDKDYNIYVYSIQDGKLTRGKSIGVTNSTTLFYDYTINEETGKAWGWIGTINPNDKSGESFFGGIIGNTPSLDDYMSNAKRGEPYDFKRTNGTNTELYTTEPDFYRGMPIGTKDGKTVYTSARDIGNITAGYVAGANGMPWGASRVAFDALQSKESGKPAIEGLSTRNAQYLGWKLGYTNTTPLTKMDNFKRSIKRWLGF